MKPTKRIVCGTDFSSNAVAAADVAAAIAQRLGATLVLVHVADEAHSHGEGTKELRLAIRQARAQLNKEVARLRSGGLLVEPALLHGRWAEYAIGDLLAKEPPLLVVVSSVSKTAFYRWTLGSTSEHIAQHAPVPTLVVRSSEGLLAWARQEKELNVVVAVDLSTSSDAALAFLRDLRKVGACRVTVAHIDWPSDARQWAPGKRLPLTSNPPRVRRLLLRELRRKAAEFVDGTTQIRLEPNWGRPDAALVQLASDSEADLIIVGTHQRHGAKRLGHASTSRGVLRHAPVSVICVPVPVALAHGVGQHPRVQRVLAATDLSPSGDQAIPWAYATVAAGGVVKLVHVIEPWLLPSPLVTHYEPKRVTRGAHHARRERARDKLAALVPADAALRGIQTEVEIVDDRDPAHGIGMAARRFGPDLICLSTGERPAIAKALFGSVARRVMAQNVEPVLLVKPKEP
jgi:nucleotide-binding universal stress UspA family protein